MPDPSQPTDSAERLRAQWQRLPAHLRTPNQISGRTGVGCAATHHVMERCDFACTCCYLSQGANRIPALPFAEVQAQLDTIRGHLGPGGKTQITAGEVTLLPVEDLGRIVAYARQIGLDPMVMTHGQRLLKEPDYLIRLVRDYGLQRVSIHIDTTQRGRAAPFDRPADEATLNPLRDQFADLIRRVRKETGQVLTAASTVTVTLDNVGQLGPVLRWFVRNADAFRLVNFLPVAAVGRTRSGAAGALSPEGLHWAFEQALGMRLNASPLHFGHPGCNAILPLVILQAGPGSEPVVIEAIRADHPWDAQMLARCLDALGASIDWSGGWRANLRPMLGRLLQRPRLLAALAGYGIWRGLQELPVVLHLLAKSLLRGHRPRLRPFVLSAHRFMSPGDLETETGQERLQACIFKVPVDGEMIPMCTMNAEGVRERIGERLRGVGATCEPALSDR
ncbi:MAG: radical SAM protein [Opitutales bacterium]